MGTEAARIFHRPIVEGTRRDFSGEGGEGIFGRGCPTIYPDFFEYLAKDQELGFTFKLGEERFRKEEEEGTHSDYGTQEENNTGGESGHLSMSLREKKLSKFPPALLPLSSPPPFFPLVTPPDFAEKTLKLCQVFFFML